MTEGGSGLTEIRSQQLPGRAAETNENPHSRESVSRQRFETRASRIQVRGALPLHPTCSAPAQRSYTIDQRTSLCMSATERIYDKLQVHVSKVSSTFILG
jgi:hypothetical protein